MQAVICADIAPLYAEPMKGTCIDEALYGMTVELCESADGFSRIRTQYHYEGWVPETALHPCTAPDGSVWQPDCRVKAPYLDVLDAPKVQGMHLQSVPRGGLVCSCGAPDAQQWQPVRLTDGRVGYAKLTALAPLAPAFDTETASVQQQKVFRAGVCETALGYLGTQYRWGGKSPLGIDCSGLTSIAYLLHGVVIYRDAAIKDGFPVRPIPFAQAQQGDLLYFPGHIALYLGGGRFVHATAHPGSEGVVISSFDPASGNYRGDLLKAFLTAGTVL